VEEAASQPVGRGLLVCQPLPAARKVPEPMHGDPAHHLVRGTPIRRSEDFHLVSGGPESLEQLDQPGDDHVVGGTGERRDHVQDAHRGCPKATTFQWFAAMVVFRPMANRIAPSSPELTKFYS